MTKAEWLGCSDPQLMLNQVRTGASTRKFLLLAAACSHRIWDQLPFDDCRRMVEAVERLADNPQVSEDDYSVAAEVDTIFAELQEGYVRVHEADNHLRGAYLAALSCGGMWHDPDGTIESVLDAAAISAAGESEGSTWMAERQAQARLLHDLFPNPFLPVSFETHWRTKTVASLASNIYSDRASDRMPILADALQEAGCDNEDILNHCRGDSPHVRGCWVVDLVLGKA